MTEDQFEQLIKAITPRNGDHELLIRIDERLFAFQKTHEDSLKRFNETHLQHVKDDAMEFSVLKQSNAALHKRIDGFKRFQWMIAGGITLITVVAAAINYGINIYKAFDAH